MKFVLIIDSRMVDILKEVVAVYTQPRLRLTWNTAGLLIGKGLLTWRGQAGCSEH